jgi:hypothetical protein
MRGLLRRDVDVIEVSDVEQSTSANGMWVNALQGGKVATQPVDDKPIGNAELIPGTAQA